MDPMKEDAEKFAAKFNEESKLRIISIGGVDMKIQTFHIKDLEFETHVMINNQVCFITPFQVHLELFNVIMGTQPKPSHYIVSTMYEFINQIIQVARLDIPEILDEKSLRWRSYNPQQLERYILRLFVLPTN